METSICEGKHDTQWTAQNQLDDLDFAGDLAQISHTHKQIKTANVAAVFRIIKSQHTQGKNQGPQIQSGEHQSNHS
ncbi:unnamed protein product [Schistosoma margrebowiei]|uniref:Uncharacterized protein n=1 Tax=Schistosoma margrebowiei TaxID=48269 RepID=A0A183MBX2_9TREM|nr:unnamed protein product [Schistosoma margrebowiei]